MGHQRLGLLPRTRRWEQVISLIAGGCDAKDVAGAAMEATQKDLADRANDVGLLRSFWLLLQIPAAARQEDFAAALRKIGIDVPRENPTIADLTSAFTSAVDREVEAQQARSDLGEMAEMAAVEVLVDAATPRAQSLFGPSPDAAQIALAENATEARFAALSRNFFSRFMERFLSYYVGRELPLHVGATHGFDGLEGHREFVDALSLHCRQASLIVEKFAGAWYSKAKFEGDLNEERTRRFIAYSLKKIRDELVMGASP